jgi:AraC family transcriptional regulator
MKKSAASPVSPSLTKQDLANITRLVGRFTESQVATLLRNIEFYLSPEFGIFIPVAGYCDFAIMPNHAHPGYSFVLYLGRPGGLIVEGKKVVAPAGKNLCAFSPGVVHEEVMEEGFNSYIAIMIDKKRFEKELAKYGLKGGLDLRGAFFEAEASLVNLLKLYMAEYGGSAPGRDDLLGAFTAAIIHSLIRTGLNRSAPFAVTGSPVEFNKLVAYLTENLHKKISIDEMARVVHLSPSHFAKLFKRHSSVPPMEYVNSLRIEKAKRLIKFSPKSCTDIAFDCGFTSSSYFSAKFLEAVGISPAQYRKSFGKS